MVDWLEAKDLARECAELREPLRRCRKRRSIEMVRHVALRERLTPLTRKPRLLTRVPTLAVG